MGCDIHMMIEYVSYTKQDGSPAWYAFGGRFNPGRDYSMFGALAGVRDDEIGAVVPIRGMPENKSYEAASYYDDDGDLHSATWLSTGEYAQAYAARMLNDEYGPPDVCYEVVMVTLQAFEERGVTARVLVAFDN